MSYCISDDTPEQDERDGTCLMSLSLLHQEFEIKMEMTP